MPLEVLTKDSYHRYLCSCMATRYKGTKRDKLKFDDVSSLQDGILSINIVHLHRQNIECYYVRKSNGVV